MLCSIALFVSVFSLFLLCLFFVLFVFFFFFQAEDGIRDIGVTGVQTCALPILIDCDPFLAVNSDNLWVDGPADTLKLLASHWDDARMDALLLLVLLARAGNHRGQGDFHMDCEGRLRRREKARIAPFVYTGVQIVSKRLLRDAPEGPFSTNILWDRASEEGRCFGV